MSLFSLDGYSKSSFISAELINLDKKQDIKDFWLYEYMKKDADEWRMVFGEILTKGIVPKQIDFYPLTGVPFKREGIVFEFSKLKTEKDIINFAMKYGQLGIYLRRDIPRDVTHYRTLEKRYGKAFLGMISTTEGYSCFEPIQLWRFYIDLIQKNLKLYRALVNNQQGKKKEIEDDILRIDYGFFGSDARERKSYNINWYDGQKTGTILTQKEIETLDFISIGRIVLIDNIERMVSKNIEIIAAKVINTNKSPLGFTLVEGKKTYSLLTAIYYDFWQLISKNQPVHICENPNCRLPFNKTGRRKFCSNACKQEAYLIRKGIKETEKAQLLQSE